MRNTIAALAVAGLSLTPADTLAQTPTAAEVAVPAEIGTFRIAETHRYPDARLGTLYRYRNGSDLAPDVYVYPIEEGPGARPLNPAREEGMNFGNVLTAQRAQRRIAGFSIITSEARQHLVGTDTIHGWHVYAEIEARGKSDSHLYLYAIGSTMVKVRVTAPQGRVKPEEVADFVQQLLATVAGLQTPDAGR